MHNRADEENSKGHLLPKKKVVDFCVSFNFGCMRKDYDEKHPSFLEATQQCFFVNGSKIKGYLVVPLRSSIGCMI